MNAKQVKQLSTDILETMADALNRHGGDLIGADVEAALAVSLAEHLGPSGGVMLVWYDPRNGVRLNPAQLPREEPVNAY